VVSDDGITIRQAAVADIPNLVRLRRMMFEAMGFDDPAQLDAAGVRSDVEGFLAAAYVPHRPNLPGQELLLSVRLDPAFGPVVVVGVGGTLTEWYGRGSRGGSRVIFPAADLAAERVADVLAVRNRPGVVEWEPREAIDRITQPRLHHLVGSEYLSSQEEGVSSAIGPARVCASEHRTPALTQPGQ